MDIKYAEGVKPAAQVEERADALAWARQSRNPFVRPMQPTARQISRRRRQDSAAMARKSRRRAFQLKRLHSDAEQNFRGQARVYFGLSADATPAMRYNVEQAVARLAEMLSSRDGIPYSKAFGQVEERMRELLVAYGDLDADVAIYGEGAA